MEPFIEEPAEIYHASAKEYLSSHQLIQYMQCPYLFYKKKAGLIEERESPAFLLGRAAHTRILEGVDAYELQYAVGGPINPKTGKPYGSTTKAFTEWQDRQSKPVISFDKAMLIEDLNAGVLMNEYARELLSDGLAEGVVRANYCGVPSQIRLDWFHPKFGIVDLKTCETLDWFEQDAKRYRYHNQLAFYQCVLDVKMGQLFPVHIIAVEKSEPHRCGVWRITPETLLAARAVNEAAIARYKRSRENDRWETGYEELRILNII